MKRYGVPLIVIVVGSLVLFAFRNYLSIPNMNTIYNVLIACLLFMYGVYLNGYKSKKGDTWIKKFIIMALFILLLLNQLGVLYVAMISKVLNMIGATSLIYYMLYIYLGYIFF